MEKGNKSHGTVTDIDGNFSLRVSKSQTVVVSYVGYKAQEVSVAGKKTLDITLHEDAEMLSDVVVIGYGTVKKADLAGSVAVMDSKSFKDQPVAQRSYVGCAGDVFWRSWWCNEDSCAWYKFCEQEQRPVVRS